MEMQNQIRQVWSYNLEGEFYLIRCMVSKFKFATFDTEFPGVIFKPPTHPHNLSPEERYNNIKANVDIMKLIQFGLTLSDPDKGSCITWEFNFKDFNLLRDRCSIDSIKLLHSQGIDFHRNQVWGVDSTRFAELFWSSGLICNNSRISWITFHGAFDFGYLIKLLSGKRLPMLKNEFSNLVRAYFGNRIHDIKYIIKFHDNLYGGLEKVGQILNVKRLVGQSHQAGSDSLLTWQIYQRIRENFSEMDSVKFDGVLFGLDAN